MVPQVKKHLFFEANSYKVILREYLLLKKKHVPSEYTFQKLADYAQVQKSYLSQVLGSTAHLNDDQLFLACRFLGFSNEERELIHALHERERSEVDEKKGLLNEKIENLRRNMKQIGSQLEARKAPQSTSLDAYYADPILHIVHMFLTVERYQKKPSLICQDLNISDAQLRELLTVLESCGLIKFDGISYNATELGLHLNQQDRRFNAFRTLIRLKAIERIAAIPKENCDTFAVVFSCSRKLHKRIQSMLLDLIREAEAEVGKSKSEEVFQLNIDLIPWSFK